MRIHAIINNREWLAECDNVLNPSQKPKAERDRVNYNFVSLVMEGYRQLVKEQMLPSYYCHECSSQAGRRIEHRDENPFLEFRNKWQRYAKELNELHYILY